MKVNFQKILCITLSLSICICACFVSVSADDYSGLAGVTQNDINYIKQTLQNAQQLVSGEITVQDAFYKQMSNSTELISDNVKDINPFQSETELNGVTNRDYANKLTKSVRDYLNERGIDYGKTEVTENVVDMQGHGAVLIENVNQSGWEIYHYGDYGVFRTNGSASIHYIKAYYVHTDFTQTLDDYSWYGFTYDPNFLYLGDWRYEDGTSADDKTTPYQNTVQTNDPSSLTDTQLIDLLEDLLLNLKLDFPDLSSIEGLLAAILAQCQSINGKICTSTEIRSMINEAISQLNNGGGGGMSPDDLEKITCALDNLKYENSNEQFIADLKDLIGMNGEYDDISKLEVVKSHFYEKAGFITELRNLCETAVLAYKNSDNSVSFDLKYNGHSYNVNFDFWEQYMPMIRFMLAAVIYLGFAWRTYRKIPSYISGGGDDN